jgi:pimeloyl-ACP methyl ester carboxylesterase
VTRVLTTVARAAIGALAAVASIGVLVASPGDLRAQGPVRTIHEFRISVDAGTIRVLCTDGLRQIVFLHGASSVADTWRPVLERLDPGIGACAYDRRGNGNSFPAPQRRGWYEFIDELRGIHRELGFESEYVLVGHSLGGLYGRLYAMDRPGEISGLVLIDPAHEDLLPRLRPGMPDAEWERANAIRAVPNEDGIVERELDERLRRGRLPHVPVTVITAAIRTDDPGWDPRFVDEAARRVHASILSGITVARHIPASRSGHMVQQDQPGLVVDEIHRVLRSAGRW